MSTNKILCQCNICQNQNLVIRSSIKKNKIYICKKCICQTKEFKDKMRSLRIGKNNPNYGKHHSDKSKKLMSQKCWLNNRTKENHPKWRKDLTNEERFIRNNRNLYPGYPEWHKSVLERDNYTCQYPNCKETKKLKAHHINGWNRFPELRIDLQNGITFCKDHHTKFHHLYKHTEIDFKHFKEYLHLGV